jgi:hypothetical protein
LAGRSHPDLTAILAAFPPGWLAEAELSLCPAVPERVGLSFFSTDPRAFTAFCEECGLPPAARRDEERLRAEFDLAPRHWVKLHYCGIERVGSSQYFQLHPRNQRPITTLRLFLRRYGGDPGGLAEMLQPALEREDTSWLLVLKREATPRPRLVCRVPRTVLPDLMLCLARSGHLEEAVAHQYLRWDARLRAKPHVYVSIDPGLPGSCSTDYEDVPSDCLPPAPSQAASQLPGSPAPRYVKCRILHPHRDPEWVIYLPAGALRPRAGTSPCLTSNRGIDDQGIQSQRDDLE